MQIYRCINIYVCVFSYIHILKSELLYPINIFQKYFLLNMFNCVLNQVIAACYYSLQFSSVAQLCPTLCDSMDYSTPGLPVHHQLLEFTQTQVHHVGDAIQPSHPLSSPCLPAFNLSQHQGVFQGVSSSHQVAKVLEFQSQHWSFQ